MSILSILCPRSFSHCSIKCSQFIIQLCLSETLKLSNFIYLPLKIPVSIYSIPLINLFSFFSSIEANLAVVADISVAMVTCPCYNSTSCINTSV